MPELPDITVYVEAIAARVVGHSLTRVELKTPFLLRTVEPPVREAEGRIVSAVRNVGKRIAIGCDNEVWLVLGGGALFAAFPMVYASLFSGFYSAMMLVLLVFDPEVQPGSRSP